MDALGVTKDLKITGREEFPQLKKRTESINRIRATEPKL